MIVRIALAIEMGTDDLDIGNAMHLNPTALAAVGYRWLLLLKGRERGYGPP
jgi:hypothetical protein